MEALAELIPVERLSQDIKKALRSGELKLSKGDVRYLVDLYYQMQEFRKAALNQERTVEEGEPNQLVGWVGKQFKSLETQVKAALDSWCESYPSAKWTKDLFGFGPILAAGLEAHIDLDKKNASGQKINSVSSIWRFGGYDPMVVWHKRADNEKMILELGYKKNSSIKDADFVRICARFNRSPILVKEQLDVDDKNPTVTNLATLFARRPWNARLKTLFWKIGDCIVKFSNKEKSFYGPHYHEVKNKLIAKNENFEFSDCAKETLETRNFKDKKTREIYESGKLPDGRIDLRARRHVVKIFLSHWFEIAYEAKHGRKPVKPYVIDVLGHKDYIEPPKVEGL